MSRIISLLALAVTSVTLCHTQIIQFPNPADDFAYLPVAFQPVNRVARQLQGVPVLGTVLGSVVRSRRDVVKATENDPNGGIALGVGLPKLRRRR